MAACAGTTSASRLIWKLTELVREGQRRGWFFVRLPPLCVQNDATSDTVEAVSVLRNPGIGVLL